MDNIIKITLANLCFLTCEEPVADVEGKGRQVNTVRIGTWESHWKSKTPQQLADWLMFRINKNLGSKQSKKSTLQIYRLFSHIYIYSLIAWKQLWDHPAGAMQPCLNLNGGIYINHHQPKSSGDPGAAPHHWPKRIVCLHGHLEGCVASSGNKDVSGVSCA